LSVADKKLLVAEELGNPVARLWRLQAQWRIDRKVRRACASRNQSAAEQMAETWSHNREEVWRAARDEMKPAAESNHDTLDQLIRAGRSDVEMFEHRHRDPPDFPQVHATIGTAVWDRLKGGELVGAIERHIRCSHLPGARHSWPPRSADDEVELLKALGRTWHDAYPNWAELAFLQRASFERFADTRYVPPTDWALTNRLAADEWPFIRFLYTGFIEGVWRNTQRLLADNGITGRVLLYRTQSLPSDRGHQQPVTVEPDDVPMRPLMSFSTDLDFCKVFSVDKWPRPPYKPANHDFSDWGRGEDRGPRIVELFVPVEAIVSTPLTGFGVRHEGEVVVAAHDPWPANVLRPGRDGWYSLFDSFCPCISSSHITDVFPTPL
jgi:hypothetical protein